VDILDAFDDRDLTGVKVELERRKSADERRVRRMLEVPCNRFMLGDTRYQIPDTRYR